MRISDWSSDVCSSDLELAQRLRLDLADALAGDAELLADLLEGVVGVHADAEAHAQHPLLARRQARQHPGGGLAQIGVDGGVERLHRVLVLADVAAVAVLLAADRGLQADRLLAALRPIADLLQRHPQPLGPLPRGPPAADHAQLLSRGPARPDA